MRNDFELVPSIYEARVDDRVYVETEKRPYVVQARDSTFLVCTKPHFDTVLYCIIDLKHGVRGPENLVFGRGAETREQCEAMIARLNGSTDDCGFQTEVSHRHRLPLDVVRVTRRVREAEASDAQR